MKSMFAFVSSGNFSNAQICARQPSLATMDKNVNFIANTDRIN